MAAVARAPARSAAPVLASWAAACGMPRAARTCARSQNSNALPVVVRVPPPRPLRQPSPALRGRCGARHRAGSREALYATPISSLPSARGSATSQPAATLPRRAAAAPNARPRVSRRRRARARLPSGPDDQRGRTRVRRGSREYLRRPYALASLECGRAIRPTSRDRTSGRAGRTRRSARRRRRTSPNGCPRTPSSPSARATIRPGSIATFSFRNTVRRSRRRAARWVTACRPAIAAKLRHPDRVVISFAGDGCFLMTGQELATAVRYGVARHLHRRQQQYVRHDPHAPGTPLSGSRELDRPHQSRFCPAGAVVRGLSASG